MGAAIGYATQALPQLKNETNIAVNLDEYEGSIFATIFWTTGVFFATIGGILSGWLGRKKTFLITTPIVACGWMLIGLAQNKQMLYVGRLISSSALQSQAKTVFLVDWKRNSFLRAPIFAEESLIKVVWYF